MKAAEAALGSIYLTEIDEAAKALEAAAAALTAVSTEDDTDNTTNDADNTVTAEDSTASSSAETGDASMMMIWLALFCAAGILISGALFLRRKHS